MSSTTNTTSKYTVSFGLSLALCSVLNALLVIVKEKSPTVMSAMAKMTGHHWITHSAIMLVLFLLFGFGLAGRGAGPANSPARLIKILVTWLLAGAVMIIGFYLLAD